MISAVAFHRLPKLAFCAPHASMPFAALHQPAYTSAEWSVNDWPVRGSMPTMIVGMPGLVGLRHGLVGQHVLQRDGDDLADVGARVVRARAHRLARRAGSARSPAARRA